MSKLHIITVGGTGHKILNAVIHLAACGAFSGNLGKHEINKISALSIDADDSNGNFGLTKKTLDAYERYYDALNGAGSLGLVPIEALDPKLNISLYHDEKKSLSKTFNISQYADKPDDTFIRFLYTNEEIETEFDQGFYGHTAIGTLIVTDILKKSEVWEKQIAALNDNDFVVVAGSIFGGTGASAIPVLLDLLHDRQKEAKFKLAVLMLNPYFAAVGKIAEEGLLQPDSSNFHIKAKASLYYYYRQEQFKKTNALYVIGEPESNFSFERASRGSSTQINKAHPIELFAATALIDFITASDDREDGKIISAERGVKDNTYFYTWEMLQKILPDLPQKIQTVIKSAIFYNKVLYPQLAHGIAAGVWQNFYDKGAETALDKLRDGKNNLVYENIRSYLELLVTWFFDIHKRNKNEINQNTNELIWEADTRVRLFSANYPSLFDNTPVEDDKVADFDNLVYNDGNSKKSDKIYAYFCSPPSANENGKGFAALFAHLLDIMKKKEKKIFNFGKKPPEPLNYDYVAYLSRENKVTFTRPPAGTKLWAKSEAKLLTDIADGLPLAVSESFTKNDISIPSPWSIFIMNELTLTEPKFSAINKGVYKEWCGVIALLVLRKVCLYENAGLKLEPLALSSGEFLSEIETLHPTSYIFNNQNWVKCYRLSLDGKTVAFLANNTFVCPAYLLDPATKTKLNKIAPSIVNENGDFLSPDNYFKDQSQTLNRDAKYALKLFLSELKTIITQEAATNKSSIIANLQKLLDKYITELGTATPNTNLAIEPEKKNKVNSVYSLFTEMVLSPNTANVELPFIMEGTKGGARVALIGLNICGINSASAEAAHHFVTENLMYNQITQGTIGKYKNTIQNGGIKLLYADELLCDSMIMVKKEGAAIIHAMPNNSSLSLYEVIWPINAELLELYSAETLNRMVSLTSDQEKITVSLTIKLSGKLGNHTIRKEYRMKNNDDISVEGSQQNGVCRIREKNLIPFWSLWPYAEIKNTNRENTWRRYNCFCIEPNYRGIPVLDLKPFFEDNSTPLAGERNLSTLQTVLYEFYYRRYTSLPSAFTINEKTESSPIYRGMVFLAKPKSVNAGAVRWNVGIDFGTTSTTAFYTSTADTTPKFVQLLKEYEWREGNDTAEEFEFDNDLKILSDNGDKSYELYFLDKQCFKQNGFSTALEKMDTSLSNDDATLFSGERIFWHNYENFKIMNTQEGRKERLLTNIKWEGSKSNAAKYLNQLLTQIVYQAAEKGVRNINFFFSYPTAFGPGAKGEFCSRLKNIITQLSSETAIDLTFNDPENLLTESIAAAYYFNYKNPLHRVFFCIDIGGGSTDVSIWVKTKHLFQTSVHFASRNMFIEPLKKLLDRPSVRKAVTTEQKDDKIYTMLSDLTNNRGMTDDKLKFLIETVLFEHYTSLVNRLENMEGKDNEAFKNFKYCVLIAYSGLMYYVANIIASLLNDKTPAERKIDNDITEIVLGLSGKGSKLTSWIGAYCEFIYGEAENLIKERTSLSIKLIPQFAEVTAKTETAIGMICNLDADGKPKNTAKVTDPDIYMGCNIVVKNGDQKQTLRADQFVDTYKDQFFASPKVLKVEINQDLNDLESFITFFNRIAAKTRNDMTPIDLDWFTASKKSLWNMIKVEFENVLGEDRFEPPFIIMLKVFLQIYAEDYLWKRLG
ncbi:hypothetical protein AGMMS49944_01070 [Spirochaetia bacterium]|nr:hypothetical protein AGMMS49944_01070 [Spirochaetia bacterium]